MKLFADYSGAGVTMADDPALRRTLSHVVEEYQPGCCLETGTHKGTGSTRILAEIFADHPPEEFVTIEADWHSWRVARDNLEKFRFVRCLWGKTVPVVEALNFMQHDEAIINHENYKDVFIDDVNDPLGFYSRECRGEYTAAEPVRTLQYYRDKALYYRGEGLLKKQLKKFRKNNPLIVLDSAGGIGLLEFDHVMQVMENHPFVLLLDDVHHLKHFRSLARIQRDKRFHIVDVNVESGWALAVYDPAATVRTQADPVIQENPLVTAGSDH